MSDEKLYTQEDLNNAVTKAIADMNKVLESNTNELKTLRKAYVNVCDQLEFYERRMFPLTAISSAIFQRVYLEGAKKELEDEKTIEES